MVARPSPAKRPASRTPRRSLKLAHWSLVVTLLILALMLLPYVQRW
jgi:hypothetical protein